MKKYLKFNIVAVIIFLLLAINNGDISGYSINWIILPLSIPFLSAFLSVYLFATEKRSNYLSKIIINILFFIPASLPLINERLFRNGPYEITVIIFSCILGGLFGVLARGVKELFFPKFKPDLNLKPNFIFSFFVGSAFLIVANIYHLTLTTPPDGRFWFELPISSIFIVLYLTLFFIVNKKFIKNNNFNYLPGIYNIFFSLFFLSNFFYISALSRKINQPIYWKTLFVTPYIIILGLGIIFYIILILFNKNKLKND